MTVGIGLKVWDWDGVPITHPEDATVQWPATL